MYPGANSVYYVCKFFNIILSINASDRCPSISFSGTYFLHFLQMICFMCCNIYQHFPHFKSLYGRYRSKIAKGKTTRAYIVHNKCGRRSSKNLCWKIGLIRCMLVLVLFENHCMGWMNGERKERGWSKKEKRESWCLSCASLRHWHSRLKTNSFLQLLRQAS